MPNRADFTWPQDARQARWQSAEVASPHLDRRIPVIAAKDIPYIPNANRLQNLSIYLPRTPQTAMLIGTPVTSPGTDSTARHLRYLVHIHGSVWRVPRLTSASIDLQQRFLGPLEVPGRALGEHHHGLVPHRRLHLRQQTHGHRGVAGFGDVLHLAHRQHLRLLGHGQITERTHTHRN